MTHRKTVRRGLMAGVVLAGLSLAATPYAHTSIAARPAAKGTIKIGTKNFGEEYVVSDMYKLLLEKHGYNVGKIANLAQTGPLQAALVRGDIDLYPEYTGTGVGVVLHHNKAIANEKAAFKFVQRGYKKFHLTWLAASYFNDTNGVAITGATASKLGIHTLSQLAARASQIRFAGLPDCKDRPDCLGGLQNVYHAKFKSIDFVSSQPVLYHGVSGGTYDAIEVFTTDGPIKALHLIVLRDDKGIFPADHLAPVVRDDLLRKHPDVASILNPLARYLTPRAMKSMNIDVVLNSKDPMAVARAFLQSKHLI